MCIIYLPCSRHQGQAFCRGVDHQGKVQLLLLSYFQWVMLSMSGGEGPSTGSQRIKSFTKSCAGSGVHSVRRSDWTLPCPSPFPASPSRMMYLSPLVSRPLVKYQCRAGIKYLDYMYTSGGGYHIDIEIYYGLELNVCKSETSSGNFYHHFEDTII